PSSGRSHGGTFAADTPRSSAQPTMVMPRRAASTFTASRCRSGLVLGSSGRPECLDSLTTPKARTPQGRCLIAIAGQRSSSTQTCQGVPVDLSSSSALVVGHLASPNLHLKPVLPGWKRAGVYTTVCARGVVAVVEVQPHQAVRLQHHAAAMGAL